LLTYFFLYAAWFNCCTDTLCDDTGRKQPPDLALVDLPDRHFVTVDSVGQNFICCVSVIDLDPKSFDKIPYYLTEDKAVVNSYSQHASL